MMNRTAYLLNERPELQGKTITKVIDRCNMTEKVLGIFNSIDEYFSNLPSAEITMVELNGTELTLWS